MRKFISFVLSLAMILSMIPLSVYATAGSDGEITISATKSTINIGETVEVKFTVNATGDPIGALDFDVQTPEGLEYVSHTVLVSSSDFMMSSYTNNDGHFGCGLTTAGKSGSFDVLTITYKAKDENVGKNHICATITSVYKVDGTTTMDFGSVDALEITTQVEPLPATKITLDQTSLSLKVGGTETLTATVEPTNSTDKVVWSSNNEAVATVKNGVVTAKAIGTATITATAGTVSAECKVNVACAHTNKIYHAAQDSTCKVQGWDAYSECECDQLFDASNNEISEIPYRPLSTNHTGGTATCKAKAICSVCEQPYGDLADHSYGELIAEKAATHTSTTLEAGMKAYYKCSECGSFFDKDKNPTTEAALIITAPTHTYDQEKADAAYLKSAATCTEAAVYFKSCVCGAKGTEDFTHGSANGHSMTATPAKEATCTAAGNKAYWTCLTCGKVYADAEGNNKTTVAESTLPMKEHTPVWNKDNTHHWQECSVETCKAVIEGTKKEHTYPDTWTNNSEAGHSKTCTEGNCAHVLSKAHTFDQKNTDSKYLNGTADCQTPASYFYSCVCGEKGSEAFDTEKGNHKVEYVEAKSHTCTEDGVIAHWKCTVAGCNKYFEDKDATKEITDIVDKTLGHNYVTVPHENHVKVEATCTSAAVYNTYCSVCGDENGETFNGTEMKPHDTTPTAAVAETCTTDGNYAYWTCSACSQHFKDSLGKDAFENLEATIIPKTGHSMTETPEKAATCEDAGTKGYFTCSNSCKGVYEDEAGTIETTVEARAIANLGHKFDDDSLHGPTTLKTSATCKTPAEFWYTCSNENCDVVSTEHFYPFGGPAPHSTSNTRKTEAKAETCTEDGIVAHWDCTNCGKIFADNDGALGEEITEADTVIKAHGHTEATSWSTDDETHWKVCICEKGCADGCGVMIDGSEAAHDWVKQDSSTETRTDYKCVCEATKSEYVTVEDETSSSAQQGSSAKITVSVSEGTSVSSVTVGETTLVAGSDYSTELVEEKDENGAVSGYKMVVTLTSSGLAKMGNGTHTVEVNCQEANSSTEIKATVSLTVTAAPTPTPTPSAPSVDYDYDEEEEEDGKVTSSEVKEALEDAKKDKVTINLEYEELISKRVFTELLKDSDLTVVIKGDDYNWTFKGSDIKENIKTSYFDARVSGSTSKLKAIKKLTGNATIQVVHTDHKGALPGMATLTVTVDKALRSKPINVYHYNPESKSLEPIASGLTAKNGKVSFSLDHCSDYILTNNTFGTTGTVAEKVNPETGAMNLSAATFAVVAMVGCAVIGFRKK